LASARPFSFRLRSPEPARRPNVPARTSANSLPATGAQSALRPRRQVRQSARRSSLAALQACRFEAPRAAPEIFEARARSANGRRRYPPVDRFDHSRRERENAMRMIPTPINEYRMDHRARRRSNDRFRGHGCRLALESDACQGI